MSWFEVNSSSHTPMQHCRHDGHLNLSNSSQMSSINRRSPNPLQNHHRMEFPMGKKPKRITSISIKISIRIINMKPNSSLRCSPLLNLFVPSSPFPLFVVFFFSLPTTVIHSISSSIPHRLLPAPTSGLNLRIQSRKRYPIQEESIFMMRRETSGRQ